MKYNNNLMAVGLYARGVDWRLTKLGVYLENI